jgi:hypothetical protein
MQGHRATIYAGFVVVVAAAAAAAANSSLGCCVFVLADFYGHRFTQVSTVHVSLHAVCRRTEARAMKGQQSATESLKTSAVVDVFHGERNMSHSRQSVASLQSRIPHRKTKVGRS